MKAKSILLGIFLIGIFALSLSACSDSEEETTSVVYSMGFSEMHSENLSDLGIIENIYQKALGVTTSPFTLQGTVKECNQRVVNVCKQAENSLKSQTWNGSYVFQIVNINTAETIYSVTINSSFAN